MSKTVIYGEMVRTLAKSGKDILESLNPAKCEMWHNASALQSEAGELFDSVKKHIIYGKPLDLLNVIEEIGDLEFYLEGLRQAIGISRQDCLDANVTKLSKRYGESLQYSDQAAIIRADKIESKTYQTLDD